MELVFQGLSAAFSQVRVKRDANDPEAASLANTTADG